MKKLLTIVLLATAGYSLHAQGVINFANGSVNVNSPITNATVQPAVLASGSAFKAQLYIGNAGEVDASLLTTNGVPGAPVNFGTAGGAGYLIGGSRTISGIAGGTVITVQVRAWAAASGATWEAAAPAFRAESNLIQVTLGSGIGTPPELIGLRGFSIGGVPEPSSIALGLLGLGAVALFRRRK